MTDTKARQHGINLVTCSADSITRLLDKYTRMTEALVRIVNITSGDAERMRTIASEALTPAEEEAE